MIRGKINTKVDCLRKAGEKLDEKKKISDFLY